MSRPPNPYAIGIPIGRDVLLADLVTHLQEIAAAVESDMVLHGIGFSRCVRNDDGTVTIEHVALDEVRNLDAS